MTSYRKNFVIVVAMALTLFLSTLALAQGPADATVATPATTSDATPPTPPPVPEPQQSAAAANTDDGWRGQIAVYGWFAGLHGTVGALGKDAYVRAPFSDLFHYLKGVIPVAVEADKGRFVMPIDYLWMKLGDDKGIPLNEVGQTSVNIHITQSILTPKFGYRLVDTDHWKIDALAGIRYWYLGQSLALEPSGIGNSRSANWVDGLGGARIQLVLSPKASIMVSGDAGGGGANVDYQIIGLLNYKFGEHFGLGLGWRYLDVDYRGNHQFIYDTVTSGALAGFYYTLGGKPPVPVTANCSASPAAVWSGDPVSVTVTGANFNPKHTLTYAWTANGGKLSSVSSETTSIDTAGLAPGSYSASGNVTDAKEKKNNTANCSTAFSIKQPQPPVVSCSATPTTIAIGESATITMTASDPQGWPLTYSWTNSGGTMSGSGTSVTVTATNADAGNSVSATGTATDARANLSASCSASVNVPAVQKCTTIEDWGECTFEKNPKKPWRVDNDCKDTLDKLSLRLQQMPNGKLDIVGYTNQEESVNVQQLGSQRSVNVKYYLTTDGPNKVDAGRVQPRSGGTKGQATHFYFVPEGNMCGGQVEEGTTVDETAVQPQSRNAPAPTKKHKKTAPAAPPAN
jgi:outer membrane protein OmpA-like peptidoglycan-associated protein